MDITRGTVYSFTHNRVYAQQYNVAVTCDGDIFVVEIALRNGLSNALTNVKYGGVNMSLRNQYAYDDGSPDIRSVYCYYLTNPAQGSNNFTYTTPTNNMVVTGVARSFSGAHQTTPWRDYDAMKGQAQIQHPLLTMDCQAGDLALDHMNTTSDQNNWTPNSGQTGDAAINASFGRSETSYEEASGSTVTMGWDDYTMGVGSYYGYIAGVLRPAPAAGAPSSGPWQPKLEWRGATPGGTPSGPHEKGAFR